MDYDGLAGPYAAHRRAEPELVEALCRLVRPGAAVLEVGCGTGNYVGAVRERCDVVATGLEPSEEMLSVARRRWRDASFVQGTAEALPFAGATFDLVFAVDVVHHLADPRAALREAWRVLRPDGRVCIATEDEDGIRARVHARYFPATVEAELARYQSIDELGRLLAEAGFAPPVVERVSAPTVISDATAFRERAFSSLHLIDDASHRAGLELLERDLRAGPIAAESRHVVLAAAKPG